MDNSEEGLELVLFFFIEKNTSEKSSDMNTLLKRVCLDVSISVGKLHTS